MPQMSTITAKSYAKLNLGLSITGTRPDGFHDLDSVFVEIDLCDEITIEASSDLSVVSIPTVTDSPQDNIVYRAATLLSSRLGVPARAKITVQKRIPTGAGLGGGSSNGACVLNVLYAAWTGHSPATAEAYALLSPIAEQLGSDVPFFLRGGVAHVTGRGEHVTALPLHLPWYFLVVLPGVHISTVEAYGSLRASLGLPDTGPWKRASTQPAEIVRTAIMHDGEGLDTLRNDFEPYAFAAHPQLESLCATLRSRGALYAGMSGSGSTIFGVYRTANEARAAQHGLEVPSYVCRHVVRS